MTHATNGTQNGLTMCGYRTERSDRVATTPQSDYSRPASTNQNGGRSNRQCDNRSPPNPLDSTANQNATRNSPSKTGRLLSTNQKPGKYQRPN